MAGRLESAQPMLPGKPGPAAALTPVQQDLLGFLERTPAATIAVVATHLKSTHSTATYHLNTLVRHNLVHRRREGRQVLHFRNGDANRPEARLAGHLRDPRRRLVVQFLLEEDGSPPSINQVACILGLPFNLLKGILISLQQDSFVEIELRNGRYRLRSTQALRTTYNELMAKAPPALVPTV